MATDISAYDQAHGTASPTTRALMAWRPFSTLVGIRFRIGDEVLRPVVIPMAAFLGLLAHQAGDYWITRAGEPSTYFP